jgi:hypothetical protein
MFRPINYMFVRSISLAVLLLSVNAVGQFEVAPDHFDSTSKTETVRRAATKSPVKHKVLAGAQANRRHAAGTSRSSVSTTAHAHAATKETHPKKPHLWSPGSLLAQGWDGDELGLSMFRNQ